MSAKNKIEIFDFHVPHYFSKSVRREIGELSASTALADLGMAIVMIFEPIFLYSVLGLTVQQVLWFFAGVYFFYILFIPFGAKITSLFGYRHTMAASIIFQVLFWVFLLLSRSDPYFLYLAPIAFAMEKSLYWPGFHAIVSRYASAEQKGREFGLIYAIVNIAQMLGPLIGGFLSQKYGFTEAFAAASLVYLASAIPLLFHKEIFVPKLYQFQDTIKLYFDHPKKFLGYLGFGEELLALTIWPIFIYIGVKNYGETGMLATGASLAAAILALVIGKITDSYTKRILVKVGAFFNALVWFLKFTASSFWNVFAMDSLGRTAKDIVFIPLSTLTYIRAENSHIMPYVVFFEQSLSIGKLSACLLGIGLFTAIGGGALGFVALFILAGLFSLFYMYI